jgi:phenylacetate-CoA ligase
MPFVRYAIEDIGAWHEQDSCPCGRALPMMELLKGRRIDMFRTQDGRAVWGGLASPLFGMEGVRQFQLVQKSFDLVVARIVRDGEIDQAPLDAIAHAIRSAMGDNVEVRFEFPDEIPVLDSGKYRFTLCELDDEGQSGPPMV